ncbi:type II toxin-antitoxin system Phd/YefM family antitoxin [Fodinicola acaciae]|uniref:type II toxin-antitoxin system Phd/YefM family antitoxin n=1 Tax=Fodinicola acaciae TaxID=2681555 RepID=UPI0013D58DA0|nr:type II toxin-antitoxin system prevent-host-death family antitoxin [Fodinicola acaciae]
MARDHGDDTQPRVDIVYPAFSIGIRDLRHDTAGLLKRVEEGEEIVITNRGRAVAVLRPLTAEERRQEELVEKGIVTMPESGGSGTGAEILAVMEKYPPVGRERGQHEIDDALDYVRADRDPAG